jgi:hypothetical protein
MSDVVRVSQSFASQPPNTVHKPKYCCESWVCGRLYSFSDYLFFTGEGFGIGGSVAAFATNAYFLASGGVFLSGIVLYGHCLWRRSTRLRAVNEVNDELEMRNKEIETAQKKTEELAQRLHAEEKQLDETVIQVANSAAETNSANRQLQAATVCFEHENQGLKGRRAK